MEIEKEISLSDFKALGVETECDLDLIAMKWSRVHKRILPLYEHNAKFYSLKVKDKVPTYLLTCDGYSYQYTGYSFKDVTKYVYGTKVFNERIKYYKLEKTLEKAENFVRSLDENVRKSLHEMIELKDISVVVYYKKSGPTQSVYDNDIRINFLNSKELSVFSTSLAKYSADAKEQQQLLELTKKDIIALFS